jgi:hypothetical protein
LQGELVAVSDSSQLSLANTALIHDEVLLDISRVLADGWPVGPSFFHSLGTLAEAVVIHDQVFFDPLRSYTKKSERKATINNLYSSRDLSRNCCVKVG